MKMYDSGKVITGIVVFAVLMTSPFWLAAIGKQTEFPELEKPKKTEEKCVESKEWMRANHMQMLNDWRHEVVREGKRQYVNSEGKEFEKSLTKTCLDCHENKKKFCDKCHTYSGVSPFCWTCHVDPKEKT
jgi:hypothetical protein